jgi:anti-sigma regulatory factor (Ser/Thr protein kinase)
MTRLLAMEVACQRDVVLARQNARRLAALLGFDTQDQVRLATAVSEVARNACQYAGQGRVEFSAAGRCLRVAVIDSGLGLSDVDAILTGRARPTGQGLAGARRLMDEFELESTPGVGTVVRLGKSLPRHMPTPTGRDLARVTDELARTAPEDPAAEVQRQNRELLRALDDLRAQPHPRPLPAAARPLRRAALG